MESMGADNGSTCPAEIKILPKSYAARRSEARDRNLRAKKPLNNSSSH
jgi:hypothetical protein